MTEVVPKRGDIWHADIGEPVGHEAAYERPVLVVSSGRFNIVGMVTICPITRTEKLYPTRIRIQPGASGLYTTSYVQVEQVRTISTARLIKQHGRADAEHLRDIQRILRLLFESH